MHYHSTATVNGYNASTAPIVLPVTRQVILHSQLQADIQTVSQLIQEKDLFTCGRDAAEEHMAHHWE
jgi:hypothetical protein